MAARFPHKQARGKRIADCQGDVNSTSTGQATIKAARDLHHDHGLVTDFG